MEITQIEKYGIVCITVKGRMGVEQVPEFEKTVKKIIESDNMRLLFDLGALEYLRSSVLRVILNAVKEINKKSGKVVLCSLNGFVKEIFEVNRFKDIIPIAESIESGMNELLKPLRAA